MPSALSAPSSPHGSLRSTSPVSPEVCVSNMRTVTFARCGSFAVLKSGRYFCTGSSNSNLALFVELHDGSRRCKGLRQRRQVEDRVLGHRLCRCRRSIEPRLAGKLAHAIRLVEDDLAAMPDHNHSTRQPMCRDRIVRSAWRPLRSQKSEPQLAAASVREPRRAPARLRCLRCLRAMRLLLCALPRHREQPRVQARQLRQQGPFWSHCCHAPYDGSIGIGCRFRYVFRHSLVHGFTQCGYLIEQAVEIIARDMQHFGLARSSSRSHCAASRGEAQIRRSPHPAPPRQCGLARHTRLPRR